jgi:tetratricopeptide (TPR) repeat protein
MNEAKIRTRHLKYFSQLAEAAESALKGPKQAEWYARLDDERDNIRAALAWADKTDVEAGLYISSRLGRFWESFDMREGSYWLSTFLQKPDAQAYPKARAKALHAHMPVLDYLSQNDAWQSTAKECLELYRALGDQHGEVDVLLRTSGEISSAAEKSRLYQEALNLTQVSGDIWWQAHALYTVGWQHNGNEKLAYWERAIMLFRQAGDWRWLARCLSETTHFALLNGGLELAQKCLDEATLLNDQLEAKETIDELLNARAQIAMMQGDYNQARTYWQEGLGIAEELGARMSSLWIRTRLGYLALCEGNLTQARDIFTETAQEFFIDKNEIGVVFNLEGMAGLYVAIGKPELAAQLIGWADAARKKFDDTRPRIEQADVDKIISACIAKIGEIAFSNAYEEGQKTTLDETVEYALRGS